MFKQKIFVYLSLIMLLLVPVTTKAQSFNPTFTPAKLIDDAVFSDIKTFGGASGVQKFLETKNSLLANTNPDFLTKLKEPTINILKEGLEDPQPNLSRLRTAAELIWDAGQASGLNPQVILVTLEKEQSLVTGRKTSDEATLQKALDRALGFGCPDSGGCENIFAGFYFQLFGNFDAQANRYLGATKSLMKSFTTPGGRGPAINGGPAKVGEIITLDNTLGGYENVPAQHTFAISNNATAALYRYTPHVFNGNYNFWRFFQEWFRYPNGTLLKLASSNDVYIIQNGVKQLVPPFVAQSRGLNLGSTITVSQAEYESYPTDKLLGPADNTIVKTASSEQLYVFIANIRHPASSFVITQRGLNPANVILMTDSDANLFAPGTQLTPNVGSVLKGQTKPAIYLVAEDGNLKLFEPLTFAQRNAGKLLQVIPDAEIESYPKLGFVPPLDGTIIRAQSNFTAYLIEKGIRRGLTAELFKNRGFNVKQIIALPDALVESLPNDGFATPKDKTFFKISGASQLYMFKEGQKHAISSFVAKQRGISADYSFNADMVGGWAEGSPITPKDGSLVKGDGDLTVFLVVNGQLRGVTGPAFKARRFSIKKIITLPQLEVDSYGKGEVINK